MKVIGKTLNQRELWPWPVLTQPQRTVSPGTCSTNAFFPQAPPAQENRQTRSWITTSRPATAV
jgi:hypothetical protein